MARDALEPLLDRLPRHHLSDEVEPIGDDYTEFHDGWPVGDA
jgi:hypothetical protein